MASVTLIPNGYTDTGSYHFTLRDIENAYANADASSNYARLTLAASSSSQRVSQIYLEFNKANLSNIPSDATIDSVTANVRYAVSNTTYVSAVSIQLYADTSSKGSAVTTRSTSSSTSGGAKYAITPGIWSLSELQNIRLHISATHNKSTGNGHIYFYGADVTVNYTAQSTPVPFRVKSNGSWATPTKVLVKQNGSWVEASKVLVKDNGTWQ